MTKQQHTSSRDSALEAAQFDTAKLVAGDPSVVVSVPHHEPDSTSSSARRHPKKAHPVCERVLIALCVIVGFILLGIGSFAIWYFAYYNQPDKVLADAVNNLATAEAVTLDGEVALMHQDEFSNNMIFINFNSHVATPGATEADLTFVSNPTSAEYGEAVKINLHLGSVVVADGALYIQIGGLMNTLNNLNLTPEERASLDNYLSTIEAIDNEWWRISIPEIIDSLELGEEATTAYQALYDCTLKLTQQNFRPEIGELYQNNSFMNLEKVADSEYQSSGHSVYRADIDYDSLANLINQIPETAPMQEFYACYNAIPGVEEQLSATNFNEIAASDLAELLPTDLDLQLKISNFNHQLSAVYLEYTMPDTDTNFSGVITLNYQTATVTAPDNYRPITDLVDELSEIGVLFWTIPQDNVESVDEVEYYYEYY